jgi:hypothetical protein
VRILPNLIGEKPAMKKFRIVALLSVLAIAAAAQTAASGQSSTNTNTGVSAGQQGASANAGASTEVNANTGSQGTASNSTEASSGAGINSSNSSLASGITVLATLAKSVDAKKAKQGDEVTARAAQNVVSNGSVVIPRGSKLVGHVTEVKAREKGQNESSLGIAFDKVVLKNGEEVPLQASIRAIAAAANSTAANSPMPDMGGAGVDSAGSPNGGMSGDVGSRNGGVLGGATNTAGSTAGTVGNTAGNVGGAAGGTANSTVNGVGRTAGGTTGELAANSQGVIGLQGLTLNSQAGSSTGGSVITSNTKNVKLDNGTQLVLQVTR